MGKFVTKTQEQLASQGIAKLVSRTALSDVGDASAMKHVVASKSRQDAQQYYQISLLLKLFSIDSAVDDDLDQRAKEIQPGTIERIKAVKAIGAVVFSRAGTTGSVTIQVGTRVKTSDGQEFSTTTVGTITPTSPEVILGHGIGRDSALVNVAAVVPGSAGKVEADTIIKFASKPPGVGEVTNPSKTSGGLDRESNDDFRTRIKAYVAGLARCPVAAMEAGLLGLEDPTTGATIVSVKINEDQINLGRITIYIDDGSGTAEAIAVSWVELVVDYTWNGTTTVTMTDTSDVSQGDFIKLGTTGLLFEVASVVPNTSVTIDNPSAETIPTGTGTSYKSGDSITSGLAGPPAGTAVGGESTLELGNFPIKSAATIVVASSTRGVLVDSTDYRINPASGQIDFVTSLTTGEKIVCDYTYFTGLIAFAQKVVDGDKNDRLTYPGLRAGGVLGIVATPQILIQTIVAVLTVAKGQDQTSVRAAVVQAIKDYVNNLGVSGDVVRNRLIEVIMNVPGVYDVVLTTPTSSTTMLDNQLPRTTDANITVL